MLKPNIASRPDDIVDDGPTERELRAARRSRAIKVADERASGLRARWVLDADGQLRSTWSRRARGALVILPR